MPEGAGAVDGYAEARLGDVLTKLRPDDFDRLIYGASSKPVDFENWVTLTRLNLESRHSQLSAWWDVMYRNARIAYQNYLQLPPLARSEVRPSMEGFNSINMTVERYMRRHLMRVMPKGVQQTLIHQHDVSCADIVFQALVDAGPRH